MAQQGEDAAGKMSIVRAAAGIVGHDILTLETLDNVARGEGEETHIEEIKRRIAPAWDSLNELPPTLVALLQAVTDIRLRRGGNYDGTGGWVWERGCFDGRAEKDGGDRESGGGPGATAPRGRGAEDVAGDLHAREGTREIEGDEVLAIAWSQGTLQLTPLAVGKNSDRRRPRVQN